MWKLRWSNRYLLVSSKEWKESSYLRHMEVAIEQRLQSFSESFAHHFRCQQEDIHSKKPFCCDFKKMITCVDFLMSVAR